MDMTGTIDATARTLPVSFDCLAHEQPSQDRTFCGSAAARSPSSLAAGRRRSRSFVVAAATLTLLALVACSRPSAAAPGLAKSQLFLAGPDPSVIGRDERVLLAVPRPFLPARDRPASPQPIATSGVVILARIADHSPAGDEGSDAEGIVSVRIGWAEPGYVRRSVDGSWDNHFSIYNRPGGQHFGLEQRLWQHHAWSPAEIYVSLNNERQILIECPDTEVPSRPRMCEMSVQREAYPFLSLFFREQDLPRWREIESGADRLVRGWLLPREGGAR